MMCGNSVSFSTLQEGLTSLHIACNKSMLKTVRHIKNRRKKFDSDFEVLINAKATKFVCVYYNYKGGLHTPP